MLKAVMTCGTAVAHKKRQGESWQGVEHQQCAVIFPYTVLSSCHMAGSQFVGGTERRKTCRFTGLN